VALAGCDAREIVVEHLGEPVGAGGEQLEAAPGHGAAPQGGDHVFTNDGAGLVGGRHVVLLESGAV